MSTSRTKVGCGIGCPDESPSLKAEIIMKLKRFNYTRLYDRLDEQRLPLLIVWGTHHTLDAGELIIKFYRFSNNMKKLRR